MRLVAEKQHWLDQYPYHPYEAWRKRWMFLCDQLKGISDMQRIDSRQQR